MDAIRDRVLSLNAAWREGRFDDLRNFFHPDAVIAAPGFATRVTGRDAVIASYREFVAAATIEALDVAEPAIDVWGDTAVATVSFSIVYSMNGKRYDEHGHDVLVFQRAGGEWLIVWRTLISPEA
jgi:ketosteroid isomerase-like protein